MEQQQLTQQLDKASRIAAAFDRHIKETPLREAIAIFQEIFNEQELNQPYDRDNPKLPYNHIHRRYSSIVVGPARRPSLVFLDNFQIRRVRLWCERRSIGIANNSPMTGSGFIPEDIWDRLRCLETLAGGMGFYHDTYGDDHQRAVERYREVMAVSQHSPPLIWLALNQHEKESYLVIEARDRQATLALLQSQ